MQVSRQGEVDKIEHLDMKISVELEQTDSKTKQYEEEIAMKFDRLEEMQELRLSFVSLPARSSFQINHECKIAEDSVE